MLGASNGIELGDGVAIYPAGDALVILWSKPATAERWAFQLQRMEAMAASCPDGILVLVVIPSVDTPPDEMVRESMQSALRRLGPKVRRLVAVPLGHSLWLAVMRTTLRGLIIASGQSQRHRVAVSVSEGLRQLAEKAGKQSPGLEELMKGIEVLSIALGTKDTVPPAGALAH
jgi:hypothetical protein